MNKKVVYTGIIMVVLAIFAFGYIGITKDEAICHRKYRFNMDEIQFMDLDERVVVADNHTYQDYNEIYFSGDNVTIEYKVVVDPVKHYSILISSIVVFAFGFGLVLFGYGMGNGDEKEEEPFSRDEAITKIREQLEKCDDSALKDILDIIEENATNEE